MSSQPTKLLLRVDEAAECLGVCRRTIYELMAAGTLRSITIGRARRIPYDAVELFISEAEADQQWRRT